MQTSLERLRRRREEMDDEGGFTLIELLIVVVILGILAAIVVFAVQNLTGSSAQSACKSDYKTVEVAAEAYKAQVGGYPGGPLPAGATATPATTPAGVSAGILALLGTATLANNPTVLGPWLKDNPSNPSHYQINYTVAAGPPIVTTEQVYNTASTPAPIGVGGTATATIADCNAVQ